MSDMHRDKKVERSRDLYFDVPNLSGLVYITGNDIITSAVQIVIKVCFL